MPPQMGRSGLVAKLGNHLLQAAEVHRNDDFQAGNMDLPAGIENGVAQLVDVHLGQYKEGDNKGEYFFYAAGVVKFPTEHDGIPIEGLRTQQPAIPICDTPNARGKYKTLEDHLGRVQNILKGLGCDPDSLSGDNLEATIEALNTMCQQGRGPHFRFRTWQGKASDEFPSPRTNHTWGGVIDWKGKADSGTRDNTGTQANGAQHPPTTPRKSPAGGAVATATPGKPADRVPPGNRPVARQPAPKPEPEPVEEFDETSDLSGLQAKAEADDETAQRELTEYAIKAGWTNQDVLAASSWAEVVGMIGNPQAVQEEPEADEEEAADETEPEAEVEEGEPEAEPLKKGDMVWYRLSSVDPKTKKTVKAKNPTQCEIVSVNLAAGTVTLKDIDKNKLITGPDKKAKVIKIDDLVTE